MSSDSKSFQYDANIEKLRAKLEEVGDKILRITQMRQGLANNVPNTLYSRKCVYPDAVSFMNEEYEELLAVFVLFKKELKAALLVGSP